MYLTNDFQRNLDAKGRLTLPAEWRSAFADEKVTQICLVPMPEAVYGFAPEDHKAWLMSFFPDGFNPRSKADTKLRRALASRTVTVDIDSAGRLALSKLSEKTLAHYEIEREVEVIGNVDHFEIWNAASYEAELEEFSDDEFEALMFED